MKIWVITLFPNFFNEFKEMGVVGQALRGERSKDLELIPVYLGDYSDKGFKGVDSPPYGGGQGVIMRADVLKQALFEGVIQKGNYSSDYKNELEVIYTHPRGIIWTQKEARAMSSNEYSKDIVFICGRYEGIDERFIEKYIDKMICIGDFILSGGELAVMTIIDSVLRLKNGVLKNNASSIEESFEGPSLEHPHYTRPNNFEEMEVPKVLLSGDHKKIQEYRSIKKIEITKKYRPDLLKGKNNG